MCSLPFEYCEWGPQFPKCKEWFQGNFQRYYPEVGTADLAHEDVVALMLAEFVMRYNIARRCVEP